MPLKEEADQSGGGDVQDDEQGRRLESSGPCLFSTIDQSGGEDVEDHEQGRWIEMFGAYLLFLEKWTETAAEMS